MNLFTPNFWNFRLAAQIVPSTSLSSERQTRFATYRIEGLFLLVFFILLIVLEFIPKGHLVLWFNQHYNPFLNSFFKYFTHLGDGSIFIPFCILLFWVRFGYAMIAALTGVALAVVSNILKHGVFSDHLRPKAWFSNELVLNFVEGVEIHSRNAFPSGHTATAAAVALLIALYAKKRWVTAVAIIFALLVGVSRVYLAQHFFEDVVFGYLEGIVVAALVFNLAKVKLRKTRTSHSSVINHSYS